MRKFFLLTAVYLLAGCQPIQAVTSTPDAIQFRLGTEIAATPEPVIRTTFSPQPSSSPMAAGKTATARSTPTSIQAWNGDLRLQIAFLENNMPRAGSQGFRTPSNEARTTFADLTKAVEDGKILSAVAASVAAYGYQLVEFQDRGDSDSTSYLLRELDPSRRGWGLYDFRADTKSALVIEAPHPLADEETALVALHIYRALGSRALLIAGAHRDANSDGSADVAHNPDTIFQIVHQSLLRPNSVVLQIHGFAGAKHPGYPQVVIGHEQSAPNVWINTLARALAAEGLYVGVCDGFSWQDLCGDTNVQSKSMTQGIFVHIELDETVRLDDRSLIVALSNLFKQN